MRLYAAGFNAWGQLRFRPHGQAGASAAVDTGPDPEDAMAFVCVLEDDRIENLRPYQTYTAVTTTEGQLLAGMPPVASAAEIKGCVYVEDLKGCVVAHDDEGQVVQYPTLEHYLSGRPGVRLDMNGSTRIVQMVAYDAGFAALAADGQVFTWGDPRYPECLGRDGSLSEDPAPVPFFDDLPTGPVVALAAGGYVLAARTRGDDLYCWGGYAGRTTRVLPDLTGDPTPILVSAGSSDDNNDDGVDIADMGVGEEHMIVLATDGSVYVRGSNTNGQLGLGAGLGEAGQLDRAFDAWRRVDNLRLCEGEAVVGVAAGPRNSFILVGDMAGNQE